METQFFVRCPGCGWTQKDTRKCAQCGNDIPEYPAKVVEVSSLYECFACSYLTGKILPTLAEAEAMLIREALHIHRTPLKAAQALGIGKTTIYRKMNELIIDRRTRK